MIYATAALAKKLTDEERFRRAWGDAPRTFDAAMQEKIAALEANAMPPDYDPSNTANEAADEDDTATEASDLDVQMPDAGTDDSDEDQLRQVKIDAYLSELRDVATALNFWSHQWVKDITQNLERRMTEGDKSCRKYVEVKKAMMRWVCSDRAPAKGKPGSIERDEWKRQLFEERARLGHQYDAEHEGSDDGDGESEEHDED